MKRRERSPAIATLRKRPVSRIEKALGMVTSDWIAAVAVAVSLISALLAWLSAAQAKRQADAVLGEVNPTFGVYQAEYVEYSRQASLKFEILNHNRRALLVHELSFQYPDDVIVFTDHDDLTGVIGSIIEAVKQGGRTKKFAIPHRVKGCGMNAVPHELVIPFRCGWRTDVKPKSFRFCFKAEYRQEGGLATDRAYGCVDVEPPNILP